MITSADQPHRWAQAISFPIPSPSFGQNHHPRSVLPRVPQATPGSRYLKWLYKVQVPPPTLALHPCHGPLPFPPVFAFRWARLRADIVGLPFLSRLVHILSETAMMKSPLALQHPLRGPWLARFKACQAALCSAFGLFSSSSRPSSSYSLRLGSTHTIPTPAGNIPLKSQLIPSLQHTLPSWSPPPPRTLA